MLIADHIEQAAAGHRLLAEPDLRATPVLATAVRDLVTSLLRPGPQVLRDIFQSGIVGSGGVSLRLDRGVIASTLSIPQDMLAPGIGEVSSELRLRRRGVEMKLILGDRADAPDPTLLRTLRDAHRWTAVLRGGAPLGNIAAEAGHHDVHVRTRAPLVFLSPRIQRAIVEGSLAPDLTLRRILALDIPLD